MRSPTAANVLHAKYGVNARACGWNSDYALIPLDAALIAWADEIVFMDADIYRNVKLMYRDSWEDLLDVDKVVLNIPDQYMWNEPKLIAAIVEQYGEVESFKDDKDLYPDD